MHRSMDKSGWSTVGHTLVKYQPVFGVPATILTVCGTVSSLSVITFDQLIKGAGYKIFIRSEVAVNELPALTGYSVFGNCQNKM